MKRGKRFWGVYATVFLAVLGSYLAEIPPSAAQPDKLPEAGSPPPEQNDGIPLSYQDYTDLIAGKKINDSFLGKYVNPAGWQEYTADMDQTWIKFEEKSLKPMRAWAAKELSPPPTVEGTVFYPFSGPDVVNVLAFFPNAKDYLLIALEPVGTLPILSPGKNEPFYSDLELAISELLQFNFFFTKMMEKDLVKKEMDGVLPVLLFFLGRENLKILDVSHWLMQPDGSITTKPAKGGEKLVGQGIHGVKIVFQRHEGEPEQTLYYFSFNLLNPSWRSHPQFVNFLKGFGPYRTFVKAASYLMFKPKFSDVRDFTLEQSRMILQTDEGIPLKYFDPEKWDRRFYGKYTCPIQLFANCLQPDMAGIYKNGQNVSPLPFGIGYHHRRNCSNLMVGQRKVVMAGEEKTEEKNN